MSWKLEYDAGAPPLPRWLACDGGGATLDPLPSPLRPEQILASLGRRGGGDLGQTALDAGCHHLRIEPRFVGAEAAELRGRRYYDGPFRVDLGLSRGRSFLRASGDLYLTIRETDRREKVPPLKPLDPEPGHSTGIRIFPRDEYRYYVRLADIRRREGGSLELHLDLFRWEGRNLGWDLERHLIAEPDPPRGRRATSNRIVKCRLLNEERTVVGELALRWVSPSLRRAVVEIDVEPPFHPPGDEERWRSTFAQCGWFVERPPSDGFSLASPPAGTEWDGTWTDKLLHQQMMHSRARGGSPDEWRYHLLCVGRLKSANLGIMYDREGADSNEIPREGAALACRGELPDKTAKELEVGDEDEKPLYGRMAGDTLDSDEDAFFHVAVHEIGHAQGLYHNNLSEGFMQELVPAALAAAERGDSFPEGLRLQHSDEDETRLRHLPDEWVRPGGVALGFHYRVSPLHERDLFAEPKGLEIELFARPKVVPLGAPLRLQFVVRNTSSERAWTPPLSLKDGFVRGRVVDPSGYSRAFSPLARRLGLGTFLPLKPGRSKAASMVLLRGVDGPLAPLPGLYTVFVEVSWTMKPIGPGPLRLLASTHVLVTDVQDEPHAAAAAEILSNPGVMVPLVFRSKLSRRGADAIFGALLSDTLRPHFVGLAARVLTEEGDLEGAAGLLEANSHLTSGEVEALLKALEAGEDSRSHLPIRLMLRLLRERREEFRFDEALFARLKRL